MKDVAAFAAQSLFEHDIGHGMSYSFSSFSGKEDFLGFVRISVACLAVRYCINVFDDLVLNFQVTLVAFDFVGIDMGRMHEVSIIVLI